MEKANQEIFDINTQLGEMPNTTNNIIKFPNSKENRELNDIGVDDRTETILELKKVLIKNNLVEQLSEKCHTLDVVINIFLSIIDSLN